MTPMRLTFILAALALCCAGAPAQDDKEARRKKVAEGTHIFRRMLFDKGFASPPLQNYDQLMTAPKRSLLVVLGDLENLNFEGGGLRQFLEQGGAALIASDRPVRSRESRAALIEATGVSIDDCTVTVPKDSDQAYNGLWYCPILVVPDGAGPKLVEDGHRVAANVASRLSDRRGGFTPVLVFPSQSVIETRGGVQRAGGELFGISRQYEGGGRALVFADHSLFINEMLKGPTPEGPPPPNNFEFTYQVINWLKEEGRDRVLFVEDGTPQTKLDIPLKQVDLPIGELLWKLFEEREKLARKVDGGIARFDRSGALEPSIVDWLGQFGAWSFILACAAVAVTVVVASFLLYRLGFLNRFGYDLTAAPLTQEVGQRLPQGPLAAQRVEAMLEGWDARDVLRGVACNWLRTQGVEPPADARTAVPAFTLTGGWWTRWGLWARLMRVWQMAAGAYPSAVPPAEAEWWQREMDDLASRRQQGEWGPPARPPQRRTDDDIAA
jgi:hypothetical protein